MQSQHDPHTNANSTNRWQKREIEWREIVSHLAMLLNSFFSSTATLCCIRNRTGEAFAKNKNHETLKTRFAAREEESNAKP